MTRAEISLSQKKKSKNKVKEENQANQQLLHITLLLKLEKELSQ
jgi:hypothetical protein